MTTAAPITRVVQTCIAAPSQWTAWTQDGAELNFRYRHGRGRVESAPGDVLAYWDDRGGSFLTLESFMEKAGLTLAPDAEVVPMSDDDDAQEPAGAGLPTPEAPATPSPEPFLHGKFALFQLPDGGVLLAYRVKGSTEDRQLMIPPFILQMAGQASGLQPSDILARLQSGDLGV